MGESTAAPVVVDRGAGAGGELVLRRAGAHYEIISNGVFLMDTRGGASERLLVRAAVQDLGGPGLGGRNSGGRNSGGRNSGGRNSGGRNSGGQNSGGQNSGGQNSGGQDSGGALRLLIGGLGVGFSLAEALALPRVAHVTVVEREPAVIAWHAAPLRPFSRGALDDPRVTVRQADLLDHLAAPGPRYDALCLDIDNGPEWTVTPGNARLYGDEGLDLLAARLTPRGTLAVWSAGAAPAFEALLRGRFTRVTARRVPVPRGEPDVVYLAGGPRGIR